MGYGVCRTCGTRFERQLGYIYCEAHRLGRREARARDQRRWRERHRRFATALCRTCGVAFEQPGSYRYCQQHRLAEGQRKARDGRALRKRRREARSPAQCQVCGQGFTAKRSDAKACSPDCKKALARQKARSYERRVRGACCECGAETARRSSRCKPCAAKVGAGKRSGAASVHWKGGRSKSKGYVYLLVAPEARKGHRYRAEHIVVWEQAHGRPLPEGWVVHHKNGIKHDNRPENLEAIPRGKHNHYQRRAAMLERELSEVKAEMTKIQRVNQT